MKSKVFLAAFALRLFGRGGRRWDALGFVRSNEIHQPRFWEAEIIGLYKHWYQMKNLVLIMLEDKTPVFN